MPPQSGLDLYSFSKGLGHEIARVYTANNPQLHVLTTMHGSFPRADFDEEYASASAAAAEVLPGDYPFQPLSSTFADAARVIRRMLEVGCGHVIDAHPARLRIGLDMTMSLTLDLA
jgi:hypothetical protein